MTDTPLPEFDNPPVLEVVSGVQFEVLPGLQTRHYGQFWNLVKDLYPNTQDAPPLPEVAEAVSVTLMALPPLRRMILISTDNRYVVQLQDSRFHVNWRKTIDADKYPRFKEIYPRFQKLWDQFFTFVSQAMLGQLKPNRFELTYVNHIEADNPSDIVSSIEASVRMYSWATMKPEFLPRPNSVSAAWQFPLPDGKGVLTANLSHAERNKRQIVVLNMFAAGAASPGYALDDWFHTAHEWIVRGFTDLTTKTAHDKWGRRS